MEGRTPATRCDTKAAAAARALAQALQANGLTTHGRARRPRVRSRHDAPTLEELQARYRAHMASPGDWPKQFPLIDAKHVQEGLVVWSRVKSLGVVFLRRRVMLRAGVRR